jgi:trans-aconitate methyltransferase
LDSEAAVLEHFTGWELNDEERRYLDLHSSRFAYVLRVVAAYEPTRILDVGPHFLTELLAASFPDATVNTLGFPNPSCYREERVAHHFDFDLNDVQGGRPPKVPAHDVVVLAEVIEHLYTAPELVLGFLRDALTPGGHIVLQTPNAAAWNKRLALLRGVNPFEPIRESRRNPGHFREYTAGELRRLGEESGLEVERLELVDYFNAPSRAPGRLLSRLRPSMRQGITVVYRRPG